MEQLVYREIDKKVILKLVIYLDIMEIYNNYLSHLQVLRNEQLVFELFCFFINQIFNSYKYTLLELATFLNTYSENLNTQIQYIAKRYGYTDDDMIYFIRQSIVELGIAIWVEMQRCKLNINEFGNDRSDENDTYTVSSIHKTFVIIERYTEV